ncbi:MAG TPA: glycosyltransferase family 2 protein [bacterium]|nr:glycosyltransferase family 2 protein [bacterium]
MTGKIDISFVIPIFNESAAIIELYERLKKMINSRTDNYEIIFVNDCSRDNSIDIIKQISEKDDRVKFVDLKRNFGQTAALAAGFDFAEGDIIVSMDGDLQHLPEDIPPMLDKMNEGYDIVSGWRYERNDNFIFRKIPSASANWLMKKLSGINIHDFGTTLKAYKKDVIKQIKLYGEMHRFIPALAAQNGITICEVPIQNPSRKSGKSNYGISRTIRVMCDLLTVKFLISYSTRPLHIFGAAGLLCFSFGFLIDLVFTILWSFNYADYDNNKGLILFSVMLIIIGVQFIVLGLLSEILIRIYFESSDKKIYSVRETNINPENCI